MFVSRLKDAGAESKIWATQFGFRSACGTSEALLMARRIIEQAYEREDKALILLALDWAKVFDSIVPGRVLNAMHRFGVCEHTGAVLSGIYIDRKFFLQKGGHESKWYELFLVLRRHAYFRLFRSR